MYDGSMYLTVTSRFVPARVLWCFHFFNTTRVHLTMTWVVSFLILRLIVMLRAGAVRDELVRAHAAAAVVARVEDRDSIGVAGLSRCQDYFR